MGSRIALLIALAIGPVGTFANGNLALNSDETRQFGSETPLSPLRLGRVSFQNRISCLTCGDSVYRAHPSVVLTKISSDAMEEIKRQLRGNGMLSRSSDERVSLAVTLEKLSHDHTMGAAVQREAKLTNGGEMVTTIVLRYQLDSQHGVIFERAVESQGRSDSLGEIAESEALDDALGKNIRIFLLYLKASMNGTQEASTQRLAEQINHQAGGTRGVFGTVFKGVAHAGVAAGSVAEGALEVIGSDAMAGAMSAASAQMREHQRQFDRIQHQAMLATANNRSALSQPRHPSPSTTTPHANDSAPAASMRPSYGSVAKTGTPTQVITTSDGQPTPTRPQDTAPSASQNANRTLSAGMATAGASTALANSPSAARPAVTTPQAAKSEEPDDRPPVGGPPNDKGCWIPDRRKPLCMVVVSDENRNGNMKVVYRNDCAWGIYAQFENQKADGGWDSGANHLRPGRQTSWSTANANGQYRYNYTGSDKAQYDWVCAGEDPGLKAWQR